MTVEHLRAGVNGARMHAIKRERDFLEWALDHIMRECVRSAVYLGDQRRTTRTHARTQQYARTYTHTVYADDHYLRGGNEKRIEEVDFSKDYFP